MAKSDVDLTQEYNDEIKEYHFHVYFWQNNAESKKSAETLHNKINDLIKAGFFKVVTGRIHDKPVGPHLTGTFYVWVPIEHFARAYSWFLLNHGPHSVLIHPLTKQELKDHSDSAVWMGHALPVDTSTVSQVLDHTPLEFPELGLGYSAKPSK